MPDHPAPDLARPDGRRRRRRRLLALSRAAIALALLAVIGAACRADEAVTTGTGAGAPDAARSAKAAAPAVAEQAPATVATAPAPPTTVGPDDWTEESSFIGPYWSTTAGSDTVRVLDEALTTATEGSWSAQGLVRNETAAPRSAVAVEATLEDAEGATLATVVAEVPVSPVRAGEPAPFTVTSDVPAASVAAVSWEVTSESGSDERPDLDISTAWRDPEAAPTRLVGWADATTASPASTVVVAWLDAEDRVIDVVDAELTQGAAAQPAGPLLAGDFGDFEVSGPGVAAEPMFWGTAS